MIHDATVDVSCDGEACRDIVQVPLDYVYRSRSGNSGQYDDDDEKIERALVKEHEWIVRDGKHYCSESCAP